MTINSPDTGRSPPESVLMSGHFEFEQDNPIYSQYVVESTVEERVSKGTYDVDTTCTRDDTDRVEPGGQGSITVCDEQVGLTYEIQVTDVATLSTLPNQSFMILNPDNRSMEPVKLFCFISPFFWSDMGSLLELESMATKQMTKTITKTFTHSDTMGTAEEQYDTEMKCYNALFKCPSPFLSRVVGVNPNTHTIKMERMSRDLLTHIMNGNSINHRNLLCDMLCGLETLGKYEFAHRDIKPENVLYDDTTGVYKLTDFGLSESTNKNERSQRGSLAYVLPMHTRIAEGKNWGQANDKYGIGVVAWVAKTKRFPYPILPTTFDEVNGPQHWENMKAFLKRTEQQCTSDDMDMNRIAKYFKHEVLPMINIPGTDTAIAAAPAVGTKRLRE